MDRVRAASGRQKPTAPTMRLMRPYRGIVAFYPISSVRVRSSALSIRLRQGECSKIQGAAPFIAGALDTTELLGAGLVHTIGAVLTHQGRPLLR
jgi:hypothetical protein